MATEVPLDLRILVSLVGDDTSLQRGILQEFCQSTASYSAELDRAYIDNSSEGIRAVAHKLKSSARTVGAVGLGELCEQLEGAGRDQVWCTIERYYPRVKPEIEAITAFVERIGRST